MQNELVIADIRIFGQNEPHEGLCWHQEHSWMGRWSNSALTTSQILQQSWYIIGLALSVLRDKIYARQLNRLQVDTKWLIPRPSCTVCQRGTQRPSDSA